MLKNINEIYNILGFFSCIFIFFLVCFLMLIFGFFLGESYKTNVQDVPFESGIVSFGSSKLRFSVKFYLLAICFVIFDVETAYLYSWIVNIYSVGWYGFFIALNFIITFLISLFYLISIKI